MLPVTAWRSAVTMLHIDAIPGPFVFDVLPATYLAASRAASEVATPKEYPRPSSSMPATSNMSIGRVIASSTRAWARLLVRLRLPIELEVRHDHPRDVGRAARHHRRRVVLQDQAAGKRRVLWAAVVEADDHGHLASENRLDGGTVERWMRRALVEHQLHAVVRDVHDVSENRQGSARVRHRGDLGRHDHDHALRALDHRQRGFTERCAEVDDDDLLPGRSEERR